MTDCSPWWGSVAIGASACKASWSCLGLVPDEGKGSGHRKECLHGTLVFVQPSACRTGEGFSCWDVFYGILALYIDRGGASRGAPTCWSASPARAPLRSGCAMPGGYLQGSLDSIVMYV